MFIEKSILPDMRYVATRPRWQTWWTEITPWGGVYILFFEQRVGYIFGRLPVPIPHPVRAAHLATLPPLAAAAAVPGHPLPSARMRPAVAGPGPWALGHTFPSSALPT